MPDRGLSRLSAGFLDRKNGSPTVGPPEFLRKHIVRGVRGAIWWQEEGNLSVPIRFASSVPIRQTRSVFGRAEAAGNSC